MPQLDSDRVANLARAYQEPRLLLTAGELDLFNLIGNGVMTAEELAEPQGWNVRALRVLLDALTVMGVLEKRLQRYSVLNSNLELFADQGERSCLATIQDAAWRWNAWSQLTARVAGQGTLPALDGQRATVAAMHALAQRLAPGIAALVRPETGRCFLDVGGGSGAFTLAFLDRDRSLRASLMDRPEVIEYTRRYLASAEASDVVRLVPGDYVHDDWPDNQDLILLSAIIHAHSPGDCVAMYGHAFDALVPGGRVVIRDHIMSEDRLRPRAGALFGAHMLVCTPEGRTYTFSEIREGLVRAGFKDVRLLQDGERMNCVIEAFK
jgi:hypothetical protein